jgi:hypothetical protein
MAVRYLRRPTMQDKITFKICDLIQGAAEGRFAISALVVITVLVLVVAVTCYCIRH